MLRLSKYLNKIKGAHITAKTEFNNLRLLIDLEKN